jgi:DNA-binding HxlR family transcriptional regulator
MIVSGTSLAHAAERIGDRWTLLVVAALLVGPRRFGELADDVPGIATNVLARRLKNLERAGLVVARPYSRRPPRVEYHLTAPGQDLADALRLLASWGARNSGGEDPRRHETCGTQMEVRWHCPTCERDVTEGESELRYL